MNLTEMGNTELRDLNKKIEAELNSRYKKQAEEADQKMRLVMKGIATFDDSELVYAAHSRCECGAGMAYPKQCGFDGAWHCSDTLTGRAVHKGKEGEKTHTAPLPFAFYEIKSESQPSAFGATTRPTGGNDGPQ